ncbi:hydrogenase expression/formation protein HypE [Vibrio hangzhouensis]|uniref:hydrogenase expression/formation protein HypE n=1 Tax=Vibrio hangzhouensis TaxID=462991 RepID=UPI001C9824B9|nr:hydrogenase expression/formation protein HypE [Vibrio hangzhouensis]MBY6196424.1 hydrogenase expression/formation protein HypE [Vibrio hangzhouensis]
MPDRITLAHGSGGKAMQELVNKIFLSYFANEILNRQEDQARIPLVPLTLTGEKLAFSCDSYVVDPIRFPGGDIGKLAVCGTANDIAMSGAKPIYLSAGFIIEEGFSIDELKQVACSMAKTASEAGIEIVTGDTKVVPKGAADKLFISTSGIGVIPANVDWGVQHIQPGDQILISGNLGDHGATILNARENLGFGGQLNSDCQHLYPFVEALLPVKGIRTLRDATRGGVNAVLHEFVASSGYGFQVIEQALPVSSPVRGLSELLGLEVLNFANEGKFIAIVDPKDANLALSTLRQLKGGSDAAIIGEVNSSQKVSVLNAFGASRWLDLPWDEPMPRIC